jgi:putative hydrolase of the HAD superfamily
MIRVVAFDWGNTVMYDLDEFQHLGAMVNWPLVKVVPGIEDALKVLQPDYRLVIATNAVMSTAEQVRAALARANLDVYFANIWTALELGVAKPEPAYYDIVLRECGCAPEELVMVGDTFSTDVLGAKLAGMRAIWYNAAGKPVPADSPLTPDADLRDHAGLAAAIHALE